MPELAQGGSGIEAYSLCFLKALTDRVGADSVTIVTKHDASQALSRKFPGINGAGSGAVPLWLRTAGLAALATSKALRHRPDLIISTHLNFTPLARQLKRRLKIPYWTSLHGVEAWGLADASRRRGVVEADLLLPVSRYTRDVVAKELELPPERFCVLPNAFDPDEFRISTKPDYLLQRYGLSPDQPVILTVGRLSSTERYKGHDRILRILSEVRSQWSAVSGRSSDLRYLVVGDGDDRPRLEALAEELGVREMVIFAGKVPAEELCDHYNLCDVFAMPSTGEGFGIVFLEALACGKPVIAGNKDASRDAVLDGELGVLIDPDDPRELLEAIVTILSRQNAEKLKTAVTAAEQRPGFQTLKSEPLTSDLRPLASAVRIPEIVFQPEALRAKVIEEFGFDKFRETLQEYLEEFFARRRAAAGFSSRSTSERS